MTLSNRLACCAAMVPPGAAVADIGTDHGYLSIALLQQGIAARVVAADLREQPLQRARRNARAAGLEHRITFVCCDGLQAIAADAADTVICAGMGGDTIVHILRECAWAADPKYTYIFQPQTSGNDLRRYLGEAGYRIEEERLVDDDGRLYFAMRVRFGGGVPLTPGEQYLSPALLATQDPLLPRYFDRVIGGLRSAVDGIARSDNPKERQRLAYYETALREVLEMRT